MLVKDRKLQKTDLPFSTISSLSLKLHLNSLVNDRNIFGSFSKVFGNLRQSSENFGKYSEHSCDLRTSFKESSEIFEKSSKTPSQYVYIIKRTLHVSSRICNILYVCNHVSLSRFCCFFRICCTCTEIYEKRPSYCPGPQIIPSRK